MKLVKVGTALVLTSSITKKAFDDAVHFGGNAAIELKDEKGKTLFTPAYRIGREGCVARDGIIFNGVDANDKLTATWLADEDLETKEDVAYQYGVAIKMLREWEAMMLSGAEANETLVAAVMDDITIAD